MKRREWVLYIELTVFVLITVASWLSFLWGLFA